MSRKKEKPLSIEEFFQEPSSLPDSFVGINFLGHWMGGIAGSVYRESEYGTRFQREYPELDKELLGILNQNSFSLIRSEELFRRKFYQAYLTMHEEYGIENKRLIC
jgi:hypothetical protein